MKDIVFFAHIIDHRGAVPRTRRANDKGYAAFISIDLTISSIFSFNSWGVNGLTM